jgi:hypothetical protein
MKKVTTQTTSKATASPKTPILPKVSASKGSSSSSNSQNINSKNSSKSETKKSPEKLPAISTTVTPLSSSHVNETLNDKNVNLTKLDVDLNHLKPRSESPPKINKIILTPITPVIDKENPINSNSNVVNLTVLSTPAPPVINNNGKVVLIYEQYNEEFPIINGTITAESIDEVYCLSFVMPHCLIHLSKLNPKEKRDKETKETQLQQQQIYVHEEPIGLFHGLENNVTYYIYVQQQEEQLLKDQENFKLANKSDNNNEALKSLIKKDDGRNLESCSCIYGNPCVDEYGCKDWDNRFAISTKNGWKGF